MEATARGESATIVDVWAQQPTDRFMQAPWMETVLRWTRGERSTPPPEQLLAAMDAAGVDLALLSAWGSPEGMLIDNDDVAAVVARYPDRFRGVASVDLRDPMGAVREIRRSVEDLAFVGVRVIPWVWETAPDDARFYPVFVACVEAGVPFCTQIGHTGPLRSSEPGRPIPYLERVLLDFPELVIVAGHVGVPWIAEVVTLATKFPQFHVDTSAYALHRLPHELVEFMSGRGRRQVLFGTNWPMLSEGGGRPCRRITARPARTTASAPTMSSHDVADRGRLRLPHWWSTTARESAYEQSADQRVVLDRGEGRSRHRRVPRDRRDDRGRFPGQRCAGVHHLSQARRVRCNG